MREFTQRIAGEDLTRGLQPKDLGFGSRHMVELLNLKPEREGLRGYEFLDDPFGGGVPVNFPFPQVLETPEGLFLFQEDSVKEITDSTSPWGLLNVLPRKPPNPNDSKTITPGGQWHFTRGMQKAWYATNGETLVFKTGQQPLEDGSESYYYIGDEIKINTLAYQKGRVFLGGFDSDLWESTFEAYFDDWRNQLQDLVPPSNEIGKNWIAYSSIGGGDLPMWLFHPQGFDTDFGPTKDRVLDRLERNEMGWLPLPMKGEVLALKPVGENLIAYCSEGIFLIQLEFPRNDEVPPTVGYRQLMEPGVLNRGAIGGNRSQHIFIDQLGRMFRVGPQGEVSELGYQNQFEDLLEEPCVIEYERSNGDFWISFESKGFLLTTEGMCEIGESATFVLNRGNTTYGLAKDHGKRRGRLVGPPNDFGDRGHKMATSIAVGRRGSGTVRATYDYRFDERAEWGRAPWQGVNDRGIAYNRVSGGAFRPVVEVDAPEETRIDYIELRFQYSDKRHLRGPRAGEIDS